MTPNETLERVLLEGIKEFFYENAMCVPRDGKHDTIKLDDPTTWYYRFEVSPDYLHNFTDKIAAHLREHGCVMVSVECLQEIIRDLNGLDAISQTVAEEIFRALTGEKGRDDE